MTEVTVASIRDRLSRRDPVTASSAGRTQAAVALVLAPGAEGPDLLLIKRAEREGDPWSGQMGLPGGRREPGDADLVATAVRETHEEIGVDLTGGERLGQLDDLAPTIQHLPRMLVRPFVFAIPRRPALALSAEVALTLWTPLSRLAERRTTRVISVRDWRREVEGFSLGDHFVWGMTERILLPFIGIASTG